MTEDLRIPRGMAPRVEDYAGGAPPGVDETEIEGGMPRSGLAYDRGPQIFNVSMWLTELRFAVWTTFFLHKIKKGAVTFLMPLDTGLGQADHRVNVVRGSYGTTRSGKFTLVRFQVRAESQVYEMTLAEADSMIDVYETYGDGAPDLLRRLAQLVLQDMLVLAP